MRAVWSGTIGLGMINIPVKIYTADRDLNKLSGLFKTVSCKKVNGGIVEFTDKVFKCRVRYLDISKSGILRQPVFKGLIGGA